MKEGYWVVRTYKCGPAFEERYKYWLPGQCAPKSKRRLKTEIRKTAANERQAARKLNRLIHANFEDGKDLLIGLDYGAEAHAELEKKRTGNWANEAEKMNEIRKAADHELELAIRRASRQCKKTDAPVKYIAVTSDMDGKTGEAVRIHHHIIASAEFGEALAKTWRAGGTSKEKLWREPDHTGLAAYLMDQVRKIPDAKKYKPSRGLIQPEARDRVAKDGREVQPPKGAVLLYRAPYTMGRAQYIRYTRPRKGAERHDEQTKNAGAAEAIPPDLHSGGDCG